MRQCSGLFDSLVRRFSMRKGLVAALFGFACSAYMGSELAMLPTNLASTEPSMIRGEAKVFGTVLRETLFITDDAGHTLFQTQCYLAKNACAWVKINPAAKVEALVLKRNWPRHSWLVSLATNNEYAIAIDSQEAELSGFKRRTLFALLAALAVSLYFLRRTDKV
jgi:hypothetical protein